MYNYKNSHPWYSDRPNENYMSPARLQKAVTNALKIGDGYVWIYSEHPSWWLNGPDAGFAEGVRLGEDHKWIPQVYWRAIEKAMLSVNRKR